MRGLDPRIHLRKNLSKKMDCRVKPGKDGSAWYGPGSAQRHEECRSASGTRSPLDDRHRPSPARRSALDLDREAGHGETGRRQLLQIVQLFDVAIADMAAGLVAFPDQAGVLGLGVFLRRVDERR